MSNDFGILQIKKPEGKNMSPRSCRSPVIFPLLLLAAWSLLTPVQACMTFVVTPGASADGSMYLGHIEDGYGASLNGTNLSRDTIYLLYIPAADHPPGEKRLVRYDPYAEWIGKSPPQVHAPVAIGQVKYTYAYFTTNNGAMNEHQLISGEAGRAGRVMPSWDPERRVMYVSELTNLVMERCTNARDAVNLAGRLIDEYGFYSSGEALTFADPKEAWVMELAGGTPDGRGGLWVAQKIPDGQIFVSANAYRIRTLLPNSTDMLYSPRLFASAEKDRGLSLHQDLCLTTDRNEER